MGTYVQDELCMWHIPVIPVLGDNVGQMTDESKVSLDSSGMQLLVVCLVTGPDPILLHTLDELLGLNELKEQKGCIKMMRVYRRS